MKHIAVLLFGLLVPLTSHAECDAALALQTAHSAIVCVEGSRWGLADQFNRKLVDLAKQFGPLDVDMLRTEVTKNDSLILCARVKLLHPPEGGSEQPTADLRKI